MSEVVSEVFGKDLTLGNASKYWHRGRKSEVVRSFCKLSLLPSYYVYLCYFCIHIHSQYPVRPLSDFTRSKVGLSSE